MSLPENWKTGDELGAGDFNEHAKRINQQGIELDINEALDLAQAAKITGLEENANAKLYHNFVVKANGSVAALADSGQSWQQIRSRAAAVPAVANNRFVNSDAASGASANYLTADIGDSITYMKLNFDFSSAGSTNTQSVALVAWASALPNYNGVLGGSLPNSPCHMVIGATYFDYMVIVNGAFVSLGPWVLKEPIVNQRVSFEVVIDKTRQRAYVVSSDNVLYKVEHAGIGATANFACCENYLTAADTNRRPQIATFQADETPLRNFPGVPFAPAQRILNLGDDQASAQRTFVQQIDPETTNPEYTGPAIWYVTDGTSNIIDIRTRA